ncbi:extracellular solute-binding protein [Tersicoccus sp. MR15.9]|uniref:extracellular solute-binding protein n=1 Tax=Tersicoccus mangrovi TaxID=3121635 RepID=UPI002FE50FB5
MRGLRTGMVAVAVASALALTGCGGGAKPGGAGGANGGSGFSAWALTGGAEQAFHDSFDEWNGAHGDAKVDSQFFANDAYKEKIRTAVGSGNAPTLIYNWTGGTLKEYVQNKKVVDLTDSTKDLQSRILPSVLESGKVDGKVYAVPNNNAQPVVLFSNKDLMTKAGISAAPTTFDELLSDVAKLKAAGVKTPIALAGQSVWPELMWIEYLADRVGGPQLFAKIKAGDASAWSDPAMLKALDMISQLVKAGAFGDRYGSVTADSGADVALIHQNQAGMLLQGAWVYASFLTDNPDFVKAGKLGYANFPSVAGGKGDPKDIVGNPANFWSISASATDAQKKAATQYLNEALFDDTYVKSLIDGGNVPVTKDAESKLSASDQKDFLTYAYGMVKNAPNFELSWDQALTSGQSQTLLTNLGKLFLGQGTAQQFADAMKAAK